MINAEIDKMLQEEENELNNAEDRRSELTDLLCCKELVLKLASWSRKYPRGRIYHTARQSEIDGELIRIEEEAKKLADNLAV